MNPSFFAFLKRGGLLGVIVVLVLGAFAPLAAPQVTAQAPDEPSSVTIVGTVAEALGCVDIECAATQLTFDADDLVWQGAFDLPAGEYTYQAVLNGDPTTAVPAEAKTLTLDTDATVKFYYDHRAGWVGDSKSTLIANLPGTLQEFVGCPVAGGNNGNWQPDCLRTLLTDTDGDGIYTYATNALPEGRYMVKVAYNESWTENYGVGGSPGGADMSFRVIKDNNDVLFKYDPETHLLEIETELPPPGDLTAAQAHWVFADSIAWEIPFDFNGTYQLHWDPMGQMELADDNTGVVGGQAITLEYASDRLNTRFLDLHPYLANKAVLEINADDLAKVPEILKSQMIISLTNEEGQLVDATNLQIPLVLDDMFYYDGPLGLQWSEGVPSLSVWSPLAQAVTLHVYDQADMATELGAFPMTYDEQTGVWSVTGEADWNYKYYLYEVKVFTWTTGNVEDNFVTDPYSFSLSMNSQFSQIVDLNDPALMPPGWLDYEKPPLAAPEDIVLYELHLRDFSIYDESVPEEHRGKFLAFTDTESNGMKHLRALAEAGLTHVHLLPVFDIATINEDASQIVDFPRADLAALPPASEEQQAMIEENRDNDGFNWGYDPYHYTVPEGSYSTDPNGAQRILEFRQMVMSLNQAGLRVVMDVVYNHTNSSGQNDRSVLDKIVPGYYHRLNPRGAVETSTCCQNTASEHAMMNRLIADSLTVWAQDYKVDGFRFDLMGHHMVENMVYYRSVLDFLTLEEHGIDGKSIYLYGEGWNFGEVGDGSHGVNATQINLAGTGIGTFNDRIRDSIRGGSPFGGYQEQGFINGLVYDPNGVTPGTEEEQLARLLLFQDRIRVGLAGNLRDYTFTGATGEEITGADVDYNGQPSGYNLDPQEHIIYTSAHDNETLFDIIQYKAPASATMQDRVRMQNLGLSIVMLSQGVPFFHAGDDILRSKSLDKNSYNSGDWFNALDFTYQDNGWGHGLPLAADNQSQWEIQLPLLENPALDPSTEDIQFANANFREMLQIRKSSRLFRLQTAEEINQNVSFLNTGPEQLPGVVVYVLTNATDLADEPYRQIVVIFNATPETLTYTVDDYVGSGLTLHPIQQASVDPVVRESTFDSATGTFSVPGRTTVVFVLE